jgi:outer membrane protein OmpA-like peptidoglycan-associated protein
MVDNASPLRPLSTSPYDSLVTVDFIRKWFNPRLLSESWKRGSVLGSLHMTDDLVFTRQDERIKSSSTAPLEMLVENLNQFPHLNVEIGVHTAANVDNATEVSAHRAQLVADWLIENGIDPQRITHKGYGQTMLFLYEEKARAAAGRNRVVVRVE